MEKSKFTEVNCPRCKMEGLYSLEVLKGKDKLVCPSCLAEFYPNYEVKMKIKQLEKESTPNPEIEVITESEEIKIDAVDNIDLTADIDSIELLSEESCQ